MNNLIPDPKNVRLTKSLIIIASIAIPIVVALLIYVPQTGKLGAISVGFLPKLNAILNSATALCLIIGFVFIRNGKIKYHRASMGSAFILSSVFLISYVIYHFQAQSTKFGDADHDGILQTAELDLVSKIRILYLILLLSHIFLAAIIVPFVLFSIWYGLSNQIEKHKKLSKFTFPMWLYVSISGVAVYLMIEPYYLP